jgi:hypothetical protein
MNTQEFKDLLAEHDQETMFMSYVDQDNEKYKIIKDNIKDHLDVIVYFLDEMRPTDPAPINTWAIFFILNDHYGTPFEWDEKDAGKWQVLKDKWLEFLKEKV